MACRLFIAKILPDEAMLTYFQLDPSEQTSIKFEWLCKSFLSTISNYISRQHFFSTFLLPMVWACRTAPIPWWRHQMEQFSALLALCAGKSPATGEFPTQTPVTRSFDVFLDLCLNKRLSKQSWGWWFETPSRSLWRHCNDYHCPACRTTLIATRFRVAVICPIIQVPHCIRVFFYFVWFVFINHIFQFYNELCTYCNILDIYLS